MITAIQIKEHRAGRKASGLMGCIDGVSDIPLTSLKGMSWKPADPKNPDCFCHDCRTTWDPEGSIDLELINEGHERACYVYASLLPKKKDTLLELMARTDDALEDFVKAQLELFAKMEAAKSYQEEYDGVSRSYRSMTANKNYGFLKAYEAEIDGLLSKLTGLDLAIRHAKEDADKAEATVRVMETNLSNARKTMRTFLDKNF
jgi:hypothetical protein